MHQDLIQLRNWQWLIWSSSSKRQRISARFIIFKTIKETARSFNFESSMSFILKDPAFRMAPTSNVWRCWRLPRVGTIGLQDCHDFWPLWRYACFWPANTHTHTLLLSPSTLAVPWLYHVYFWCEALPRTHVSLHWWSVCERESA